MNSDPFHNPALTPDATVAAAKSQRGLRLIRFALYSHLAALLLTAIIMTTNSGSFLWLDRWEPAFDVALMTSAVALFCCPVFLTVGVLRSSPTIERGLLILCVEGGISFAHYIALLPSFQ